MSQSNVQVAVRVRPFNKREADSTCIVKMYDCATMLTNPQTNVTTMFTYDHSFWSTDRDQDKEHSPFIDQVDVFERVGVGVLSNIRKGYNCSVLSYGQTGSGKTMTLMGGNTPETEGLIPRICRALFLEQHCQVEISFLEIYAEQINDLLGVERSERLEKLVVRENPNTGTYVQGLQRVAVQDYDELYDWMMYGNKYRVTAATNMNDRSSRSHAVFTIFYQSGREKSSSIQSKIQLVDLAGSERVKDSGVEGVHLKEAININKSLTTLGRVINALATRSTERRRLSSFVPFRDSILTWLLKDSLGGNSKTIMIATISPASINYDETLSTLQYASRAKDIVNKVTINTNTNEQILKALKGDMAELEAKISHLISSAYLSDEEKAAILKYKEDFSECQQLVAQLSESWEDRLRRAHRARTEATRSLRAQLMEISSYGTGTEQSTISTMPMKSLPKSVQLLNITPNIDIKMDLIVDIKCDCVPHHPIPTMKSAFLFDGTNFILKPHSEEKITVNDILIVSEQVLYHGDRINTENGEYYKAIIK